MSEAATTQGAIGVLARPPEIIESTETMSDATRDAIRQDVETTLTGTMDLRLEEMRELQRQADDRHAAAEAAKKAERKARSQKQENLLNSLLAAQVDEAQERAKRQGTLNKIAAAALTLVTTAGSVLGYFAMQKPTADQRVEQAKPVTETITKASGAVEARIETNDKKIERLGELWINGQVQASDDGEYTRALIRAAHKRQTAALDDVPIPPAVTAAAVKAAKVKKSKGAAELRKEAEADPRDPFAGL